MPLRLHAIIPGESNGHGPGPDARGDSRARLPAGATPTGTAPLIGEAAPQTHLIPFRDLSAVVSEQKAFAIDQRTSEAVAMHRSVVDTAFRRSAVLPAPVGVVFRGPDVLKRWMELHYVSLTDALEFVYERSVARVHIVRADGRLDDLEAGSDLAAAASESLRALRRGAVASVPLRLEAITGLALSAAFLIENDLWKDFARSVDEQRDAHHLLRFDLSGPWAPYDFVRMQFGG